MKKQGLKSGSKGLFPCLIYSAVGGAVTGAAVFFFKLLANLLEELSRMIYSAAVASPGFVIAVFAGALGLALLMAFLHRLAPEVKGGGIPRSEGVLRGVLPLRWLKTLVGTVVGSYISFLAGLPLGCEGPAVLIGTSVGGAFGSITRKGGAWGRYVMTGGAAAGFAIATGTVLSGVLFVLEEVHKRFTPLLIMTASLAVLCGTCVNRLLCVVFGISPFLFEWKEAVPFSIRFTGYILLFSLLIFVGVTVFDGSVALFDRIFFRIGKRIPAGVRLSVLFLLTGALGFLLPDGVYSGHDVISRVADPAVAPQYIFLLFAVRLSMMVLVTSIGATGGIFVPTLAIGALWSALGARLLLLIGMPEELFVTAVFLGTCAFLGGTLRAPITAAVLFAELTGDVVSLFYAAIAVFAVYICTEGLNQTAFYDRALEHMVKNLHKGKAAQISHFEMRIGESAFVAGKAVRDILWPASSAVIGITRSGGSGMDMDNDGEKRLRVGDTVVLQVKYYDEAELLSHLRSLVGNEHEIVKAD